MRGQICVEPNAPRSTTWCFVFQKFKRQWELNMP